MAKLETVCVVAGKRFEGSVVLHDAVVNVIAARKAKAANLAKTGRVTADDNAEVSRLLRDVRGLTGFQFSERELRDWLEIAAAPSPV